MKILQNINLGKKSTLGVGGNANFYCEVRREGDFLNARNFAKKKKLGIIFFGIGSNIFFSKDIDDKIICRVKNNFFEKIGDSSENGTHFNFEEKFFEKNEKLFNDAKIFETTKKILNFNKEFLQKNGENFGVFKVGSGTILWNLINILIKENFDLTPLAGFPSTIGGAIAGNAGLCGFEMKDYLVSARLLNIETGKIEERKNSDFEFGYRTSKLKGKFDFVIIDCVLKIPKFEGENEKLKEKLQKNLLERTKKQPKGRSAGSFFKNPEGDFAGSLIEKVGLKGKGNGGAYFSGKHANFLMINDGAEIGDILKLKDLAKKKVKKEFGVDLEEEVIII